MKSYILLSLLLSTTLLLKYDISYAQTSIERLREAYPLAYDNEEACKKELDALNKKENTGVELAYQAAYNMVWAKHLSSPLNKLNAFKKGKNLMDLAIKANDKNVEIHFLRLTVQVNAPSILNYNQDIADDLEIITNAWPDLSENDLKNNIIDFLSKNKDLMTTKQKQTVFSKS